MTPAADFAAAYDAGDAQVLTRTLPADLDTPVSAALRLLPDEPYHFLLESVEGGSARGRYSFLGWAPDLLWRCDGDAAQICTDITSADPDDLTFSAQEAPALVSLQDAIDAARIPSADALGIAQPGLVGYLGYDMVRLVENLPHRPARIHDLPDAFLMRPTMLAVFDGVRDELTLIAVIRPTASASAAEAKGAAEMRLDAAMAALDRTVARTIVTAETTETAQISANVSREDFCAQVEAAQDLIAAGDIFQVVLSRRFEIPFRADSLTFYRSLRRLNPAPFLFHLKFGTSALIGSSPEILVRARAGTVTVRPIAGTRPRGKTPEEDRAREADLLADAKERAEHLMLLDLGRNDLGRVAAPGSVSVTQAFGIERYSHVMHIVSNVDGRLADGKSVSDALFAGFPAGTVSGAPKVRAMEIIDAMEPQARGPYAGAVGYFGADGDMDSCIVLRTALLKDGVLHIQAGAGIVADSDPMAEAMECEHKAAALVAAARDALSQT